ncbi:MAG: tRNA pseudouridine(38-40) synthase TruA [Spirochaetia bacterium]|nr:tRNA pseudouridine(38-40) synthase TruA [Spirochaetia bacterium]MBP5740001.1 tRNA pseudouridine(38-40) synthase TruA [Spirochaetia bacterium]
MANIKLTVAYDGTAYCGWQIQNDDDTIQGRMEKALDKLHGHPVKITGAGRTDSGVHARGQCANFITDMTMPPEKFKDALNSFLPPDIRILRSEAVDDSFHARYDATERIYKYYILPRELSYPWLERYCLSVKGRLDINRLNELAAPLVGSHSFASFASVMEDGYPMERRVNSAVFYQSQGYTVFKISADGFLRRMVRSIVGTVLDLYDKGEGSSAMKSVLDAQDRSAAGACAPAKGLFLDQVIYGKH